MNHRTPQAPPPAEPPSESPQDPSPAPAGQPRLRPPENPVERRAITLWMLQGAVFSVPLLVGAIVAYIFLDYFRPGLLFLIVAAVLFLVVSVWVEPFWRFRVHRWETTDEAVYGRSGWLVREWRVAPISRIQTVDAVRGPIEQLLGLATLRVTTASSRGAIEIPGVDGDVADRTAEQLRAITQRTPGDAT